MHHITPEIKLESLNNLGRMIGENAKLPLAVIGSDERGFITVANARKALHQEPYEYETVNGSKRYVCIRAISVSY